METLTSNDLIRIKRMMKGSSFDKDVAEEYLKVRNPADLPLNILEIWTAGSSYDKFRAGRVYQTWGDSA